jgi:hypothetical protein
MNKILIIVVLLCCYSCWSEGSRPNLKFVKLIEQQAALDSCHKTTIILEPKKVNLGPINKTRKIEGDFWIKNTGTIDFHLSSISTDCDCCTTQSGNINSIKPNDSLKVKYSIDIQNVEKNISHAFAVIGNCQYGNQTFLIQAFINN